MRRRKNPGEKKLARRLSMSGRQAPENRASGSVYPTYINDVENINVRLHHLDTWGKVLTFPMSRDEQGQKS